MVKREDTARYVGEPERNYILQVNNFHTPLCSLITTGITYYIIYNFFSVIVISDNILALRKKRELEKNSNTVQLQL